MSYKLCLKRTNSKLVTRNPKLLFFFLLCLSPAYSASASAQGQNVYDRLEQVAGLIRQGDLTNAEAELNAILRRRPEEPNALNFLGVIRARQKRANEAEKLFVRALKSSPTLVGAYVNLGHLYLDNRNLERALWAFTEADKLAPGRDEITLNLALIHVERREFERALLILEKTPRPSLGVDELRLLIKSYLGLRRTKEAVELAAFLRQPGGLAAEDSANFAALFAEHNLLEEAIKILEEARRQFPNSYPILYNLGASYFQKGDLTHAEETLTAALMSKADDVAALRALARVARAQGEMEKSLAHLVRARKLSADSEEVLYDFGLTALHMGLILEALPVFEQLQRKQPDKPPYIYMLAAARLRKGEKGMAETLLRRYVELRPRDAAGYYLLGITLHSLNRFKEARSAFEHSLAFGENHEAEYMLGLIANSEGDAAAAIPWLLRTLKSEPRHAGAHAELGIAYAKQGDYKAARDALERAVELDSKHLRAHHQLSLVYARLGDKERARRMFALADALRSEDKKAETTVMKLIDPPQ